MFFFTTQNTLYPLQVITFTNTYISNIFFLAIFLTNTSRPDRLRDIADRFNLDHSAMLDNVLYARAYTSTYNYSLTALIIVNELN